MCCFSPLAPLGLLGGLFAPAFKVAGTRIFARHEGPDTQLLAYAMRLTTPSPVAMILPLPTRPGDGEGALGFIDLSTRPRFFEDLEQLFQPPPPKGGLLRFAPQSRTLTVHKVGAFEASFVPSVDDFDRLDPRFRLPAATWDDVPDARLGGFAVFLAVGAWNFAIVSVHKSLRHPSAPAIARKAPRAHYPKSHFRPFFK